MKVIKIVNPIDTAIQFVTRYWYIFGFLIIGVIALVYLTKHQKNKVQYYSQIEINKKLHFQELNYNPTMIKRIRYKGKKWKVYGELIRGFRRREKPEITEKTTKIFTSREIRDKQLEAMRIEILQLENPDFIAHDFLIKKGFLSKKEGIRIKETDFISFKANEIWVNQNVNLIYYNGFYVNYDFDLINTVHDDNFRFQSDLMVDGSGQQQKDFSRIRTDYAHEEAMTDKQIEAEKEKEKNKRMGSRT